MLGEHKQTLVRIVKEILLPYWPRIAFAVFLMMLIAATNSFQAYLIQPAVDNTLFKSASQQVLYQIPVMIIVVTLMKGIAMYYQQVLSASTTAMINNNIRVRLFSAFIKYDMADHNESSAAKMISMLVNDINGMMGAINLLISGVFKNLFSTIFLIAVMAYMNIKLTLIAFIGLPLAIVPFAIVYRKINKYMKQNQRQLEMFTVVADDGLRAIKLVKATNSEEHEINRLQRSLDGLYKIMWRIARVSNVPSPLNETLIGIGTAAVLFYGGSLVMNGHATPGSFFAFFAALMMAYKPMKAVGGMGSQLQICLICAGRVFDAMDKLPKIKDKPDAISLEKVTGNISFDKVDFSYRADVKALNEVSFDIEAGKHYAFVGHSGGGKSTIMSLLLRFYDVNSGVIKIEGHDIRDITLASLRKNISYVGQDVQLFDLTVRDNILYAKPGATDDEMIEAAKMAEAHEFITQMPNGYLSAVGQNGQKLSGGQRQRISIARAILKNSPILLLDEATSALDPISESLVQKAITKLMESRTTLTIAHRLSTVINADKIFVMQAGKIVEQGTHADLMQTGTVYKELYSTQFKE